MMSNILILTDPIKKHLDEIAAIDRNRSAVEADLPALRLEVMRAEDMIIQYGFKIDSHKKAIEKLNNKPEKE